MKHISRGRFHCPLHFVTVDTPVRLDGEALFAVSDCILNTSLLDTTVKLLCQGEEQGFPLLLGLGRPQLVHLSQTVSTLNPDPDFL